MPVAVITGANRGIGFEMASQLKDKGYEVIAVCRKSSSELKDLGCRIIEGIDVSKPEDISKLKTEIGSQNIDLLINNAGIFEKNSLAEMQWDTITKQFEINSLGPLRVTEALYKNISNGGKVALITSRMGSIADNGSGGSYGYRMSKSALNAAGMSLAHDLKDRGISVALLHPGWVKTEMTGYTGNINAVQSAAGLLERIDGLNLSNSGTFWHMNGEVLAW